VSPFTTLDAKASTLGKLVRGKKSVKKGENIVMSSSLSAKIETGNRGENIPLPLLSGSSVSQAASPGNESARYARNGLKSSSAMHSAAPLYTLKLSFEKPTSYLMVPIQLLEERLNNEKAANATTARSKKMIILSNNMIVNNIVLSKT